MKTQLSKKVIAALLVGSFIAIGLQSCEKGTVKPVTHTNVVDSLQNDLPPVFDAGRQV